MPSGTSNADKCYCFSFNLFTTAGDRDGRAHNKNTPGRLLVIQTSRSVHRSEVKKGALNDNNLSNFVSDDNK